MKEFYKFLGIIAIGTVIVVSTLALMGCDNSTGSSSGGGDDPPSLTGNWVDDRDNPTRAFIFTNVSDAAISGAKVAYYSTNLTDENQTATGTQIYIGGTAYTYSLSGNAMTVTGYSPAAQQGGNPTDVTFNRAQGTSGSTMHGIWVSNLASTSQQYTLLIIRTGSASIYTSVGSGNWGQATYTLSSDANATYVKWDNGNPTAYTLSTDPTQLAITPPGGNRITGLITLSAW